MKVRMSFCLLMAILQVITWYSLGFASSQQLHEFPPAAASDFSHEVRNGDGMVYRSEVARGELSRLGSRPPSCRLKCEGCVPCDAIQIPESEFRGHVHVQYANYEPEGWKCKCGLSIFDP